MSDIKCYNNYALTTTDSLLLPGRVLLLGMSLTLGNETLGSKGEVIFRDGSATGTDLLNVKYDYSSWCPYDSAFMLPDGGILFPNGVFPVFGNTGSGKTINVRAVTLLYQGG